jgi:hypothetical protein
MVPQAPAAVAHNPSGDYSPLVVNERATRAFPPEVEARRAARRERERHRRMRARRRAVAVLVAFLVVSSVAAAWAFWPKGAAAAESPKALGAFRVLPGPIRVASIARTRARMAALQVELSKPPGPPPPPPLVPAPGVKTIVLDKSEQKVTLYNADGTPVDRFPCASGHLYPRVGTYKVSSRKPQSMYLGDRSTFKWFVIFAKADTGTNLGFHSIPHDGEGNDIGGLGTPESHGCVRLADDKAKLVYDWAKNGTQVVVKN